MEIYACNFKRKILPVIIELTNKKEIIATEYIEAA
jgi:hypothetical protein